MVLLLLACGTFGAVGCFKPQPYATEPRMDKGLVVVLPGIEGRSMLNEDICKGLDEGGVNWAIEIDDWTTAGFMLYNQMAEERNHKAARRIAKRIEKYKQLYPHSPVVLVGHSGGGAMAIWIAEKLSAGVTLRGLILINASISTTYNLEKALGNTTCGIINFYSPQDYILLGAGTTIFTTMDGKHEASAGMKGFVTPKGKEQLYKSKLFQIQWVKRMAYQTGHSGGHFASSDNEFVARYVAPFVLNGYWSQWLVNEVKLYDMRRTYGSPRDLYENVSKEDFGLGEE